MSKLLVQFDKKNTTIPNDNCCAEGVSSLVTISGMVSGHKYYCELSSISSGTVTFVQNNFYITSQTPSITIPVGFILKDSRSYIIKFKITDLDYRKEYKYWIPNKNEWYKSAYYDAGTSTYKKFATGSNTDPTAVTSSTTGIGSAGSLGNFANYNLSASWNNETGNVTTVGTNGGPSFFGTYDQNGNINEWIDDISTKYKPYMGGSWSDNVVNLKSIRDANALNESAEIGFRLGAVSDINVDIDSNTFVLVSNVANNSDTNGLGKVDYDFYIKKYPVTNAEYVKFLNAVATKTDKYGLYNTNMTTNNRGGILRSQNNDQMLVYTCKNNMDDKPVNFVSWTDAARYCNWMHNISIDKNSIETERGAYDFSSNTIDIPYTGFNYGEDIITIQCGDVAVPKIEFTRETLDLANRFNCSSPKQIVAVIKNAKIGRSYSYSFDSIDSNFASITPKTGVVVAGNIEQNINTVYSYVGSLKKIDLRLEVIDLVDNIKVNTSMSLNCEDCKPSPTPTPTPNSL